VKFVREFDYVSAGRPIHVTDMVDTHLVTPRERSYEQAGAASAQARGVEARASA
jgi:succinate dehydrogenase / fumarate reductase, flavoprotein subunit